MISIEAWLGLGWASLFFASFAAATFLPVASEGVLVAMVLGGADVVTSITIASVGNYLGSCVNYGIGLWGSDYLTGRFLRTSTQEKGRAMSIYRRWGSWSLLLAWAPIIGDPLCLVAGILQVGFIRFSLLVFSGKAVRYAVLAWLVS